MCLTDPGLVSALCEVRDELRAAGVRVFVFGRRQQGFNSLSDVADDQPSHNLGDYKDGMIYNVFLVSIINVWAEIMLATWRRIDKFAESSISKY